MKRVLLALLLCTPALLRAQINISTPVVITSNSSANSPCLHVGRDGTVYVSWFAGDTAVYFARSLDGGQSFSKPVLVAHPPATDHFATSLQRVPNFAIDTKGNIHMVWNMTRPDWHADLWYLRSSDQGRTWSPPVSIMDADDSERYSLPDYAQDFPSIACDSSDNIYVSYLDNRYLMRRLTTHYVMHVERSTDGGNNWSLPVIANKLPVTNGGTCECCTEEIVASPEGHLYIAFRTDMNVNSTLDDRSIFICRSMDKGMTWDSSIRCQLGTWNLNGCPTKGPHIALDKNENLLLAWNDGRDDSGKLIAYYATLKRGANNVDSNFSMSNSASQSAQWPAVALSPAGTIAYAFMPSSGGGSRVLFTYSSNGGNSWNRQLRYPTASTQDQALPSIAFGPDGKLYSAWQEGSGATTNGIASTVIQGWQTSAVRMSSNASQVKVYPNPSASTVTFVLPNAISDKCELRVTNSAGVEVMKTIDRVDQGAVSLNTQSLSWGTYYCQIQSGENRWNASFVIY